VSRAVVARKVWILLEKNNSKQRDREREREKEGRQTSRVWHWVGWPFVSSVANSQDYKIV